jgi:drug/metabolite transporter (DMT)-like permease
MVSGLIDRWALVLVAIAAMLWGTDTLFRIPLLGHLAPDPVVASTQLVLAEHLILSVAAVPLLWIGWRNIRRLTAGQWTAVAAIGIGASALATVLFTLSFTYGHFIETLLLQKTQPLVAIFLARAWLGERLPAKAYAWALVAIVGAYLVAVPDPFEPQQAWVDFHIAAAAFAVGASVLWGSATVLGRYALSGLDVGSLTGLRFTFGMPALLVVLWLEGGSRAFGQYRAADLPLYLGLALLPGLVAMLLYYRGLESTPATMATLAELAFPITGILVNLFLVTPRQSITPVQVVGTAVLWGAIAALDLANARRPARVERAVAAA